MASDKLFGLMLSEPFKLDIQDYNKILEEQRLLKNDRLNDFISLMRTLTDWKNPEIISKFLETFDNLQTFATTNSLRNTIIEVVNRTGILEYFYTFVNFAKLANIFFVPKRSKSTVTS